MARFPITFKAAILERSNQPLAIDRVTFQGPLQAGQVLVRIHYSGICGKQIEEITAARGPDPYLPHMLGHEGGGIVVETGPGVTKVSPGDKVVLHWMKGAGIEAATPIYVRDGERINAGWITTFNEWGIISENRMTPLPADADLKTACLLGCAASTGLGTAFNEAALRPNESVCVVGCGGVGLNVIQGAAIVGAYPIVAVDTGDEALERAAAFGATHRVRAATADTLDTIRRVTGGGAQVVIVTANRTDAIEAGFEAAATPGRVYVLGVPPNGSTVTLDAFSLHLKKTVTGAIGGAIRPERDIPTYWDLHRRGTVKLRELIVREVPLDQINDGIHMLRSGSVAGRVVVDLTD